MRSGALTPSTVNPLRSTWRVSLRSVLRFFGVVTTLTLAIEPSYEVRQDVWLDLPLAALVDDLDTVMASGYSVSAFTRSSTRLISSIPSPSPNRNAHANAVSISGTSSLPTGAH